MLIIIDVMPPNPKGAVTKICFAWFTIYPPAFSNVLWQHLFNYAQPMNAALIYWSVFCFSFAKLQ